MTDKLKVLFLSPEVVPFAKTGGLADVAGALPAALKRLGVEVWLVIPYYRTVKNGNFEMRPVVENLEVPLGNTTLLGDVLETETEDGVSAYFIDREDLFDRPNVYGKPTGDYYDNLERYTFFANASLKIAERLSFKPSVIHCHDWQTGLVPALINGPLRDSPFFGGTPTVFTIHNLGYQGIFPEEKLPLTGLSREAFFHPDGLEFWGDISLLKAGIVYSDAVTTVSPTYAKEIQTPEYGVRMEGVLRDRRDFLHGILNGVDYRLWDPATDVHLPAHYSPGKMGGKTLCKQSLMEEMGVYTSLKDRPLLGMISRLDAQKGLDLLVDNLDEVLEPDVGLVVLGSGDERIQEALQETAERHAGRVGLSIGFDEPLAHRIMAGVDIFLIPSRYEPCGLTQMYALKYGTVPVVRATGGLEDTIVPFDPQTGAGNGFKFGPYDSQAFLTAIQEAVNLFEDSESWNKLVRNGMKADFSWDRSAQSYLELYQSILRGQP